MLFFYFIFAVLFLMLFAIENVDLKWKLQKLMTLELKLDESVEEKERLLIENKDLKQKLDESIKEKERILSIGRRFEKELKERNRNTLTLPAFHTATQGVNTSFQLKNTRTNPPPKLYVVYDGPFGFVRRPAANARVL